jgi:hypothetical protein
VPVHDFETSRSPQARASGDGILVLVTTWPLTVKSEVRLVPGTPTLDSRENDQGERFAASSASVDGTFVAPDSAGAATATAR